MQRPKKLVIVGDRVLVTPEDSEGRTDAGLILPAAAVEKNPVQGGYIKGTGPGAPVADPGPLDDEPWKVSAAEPRYVPMQARNGDYAIFFRKAAVEIEFEGSKYLVVPQSAILLLVRDEEEDN